MADDKECICVTVQVSYPVYDVWEGRNKVITKFWRTCDDTDSRMFIPESDERYDVAAGMSVLIWKNQDGSWSSQCSEEMTVGTIVALQCDTIADCYCAKVTYVTMQDGVEREAEVCGDADAYVDIFPPGGGTISMWRNVESGLWETGYVSPNVYVTKVDCVVDGSDSSKSGASSDVPCYDSSVLEPGSSPELDSSPAYDSPSSPELDSSPAYDSPSSPEPDSSPSYDSPSSPEPDSSPSYDSPSSPEPDSSSSYEEPCECIIVEYRCKGEAGTRSARICKPGGAVEAPCADAAPMAKVADVSKAARLASRSAAVRPVYDYSRLDYGMPRRCAFATCAVGGRHAAYRANMVETLSWWVPGVDIVDIDIEQAGAVLPITGRSWNKAAYARLAIPLMDTLRKYDRVVWVDCDIDICSSMFAGILSVETSADGLGACSDRANGRHLRKWFPSWRRRTYINSGVLVMDLYKIDPVVWREKVEAGLDIDRVRPFPYPDQDILNCYFDIRVIDRRYNARYYRKAGGYAVHYFGHRGKRALAALLAKRRKMRVDVDQVCGGIAQAFLTRFQ